MRNAAFTRRFARPTRVATGVATAAALFAAGCGGGSGGSNGGGQGDGGGEHEMEVGGLVTRVAGTTQPPVTQSGQGAVVSGIAGGTISSLALAPPTAAPGDSAVTLAQTSLAFDRDGQVYRMGIDGANPTELTALLGAGFSAPAWSPDGSKIAFERYDTAAGHWQIYTMLASGAGATRISNGAAEDYNPTWSPDGGRIAFGRYDEAVGHFQIWVMGANGASPHRISDGTATEGSPDWSPDGSKIAFERYDTTLGRYQLYTMTPTGGSIKSVMTLLTGYNLRDPAWSPDGSKIAFTLRNGSEANIFVVRADGGQFHVLTNPSSATDFLPTWSPDGSRIAFTRDDTTGGLDQIYVMNADGTNQHRISDGQTDDQGPSWSPLVKAKRFVGAGGSFGAAASGFLVGQQGAAVTSLVVFNAQTPDSAHLDVQGTTLPTQPNLVFAVSGNLLNALSYVNGLTSPPTVVLSATTTATGALVSFDANRGTVTGVFPYTANKAEMTEMTEKGGAAEGNGRVLVYRRSFVGVWDETGKNRAPGGASEVDIDARTGRLIAFR